RVRESMVPARELRVVVALVVHVPAEHDIAEAESALDRGEELVTVDVLAAKDPVDVADADLHLPERRAADLLEDFLVAVRGGLRLRCCTLHAGLHAGGNMAG